MFIQVGLSRNTTVRILVRNDSPTERFGSKVDQTMPSYEEFKRKCQPGNGEVVVMRGMRNEDFKWQDGSAIALVSESEEPFLLMDHICSMDMHTNFREVDFLLDFGQGFDNFFQIQFHTPERSHLEGKQLWPGPIPVKSGFRVLILRELTGTEADITAGATGIENGIDRIFELSFDWMYATRLPWKGSLAADILKFHFYCKGYNRLDILPKHRWYLIPPTCYKPELLTDIFDMKKILMEPTQCC